MIKNRSLRNNAYSELEDDLRKSILQGELSYTEPISTETQLANDYSISRSTARKALQKLVNEGILRKVHGRGTFVIPPVERSPELLKMTNILLIMPEKVIDIYDRKLVSGVADYAHFHQCKFEVRDSNFSLSQLQAQYKNLKFDGIIWERPKAKFNPIIEALRNDGIPQVTISRQISGVPSVAFDGSTGIKESVEFLNGIGHTEIIFFDLDNPAPIFKLREDAFIDEMKKSTAYPDTNIYRAKYHTLNNEKIAQLFSERPETTALIYSCTLNQEIMEYFSQANIAIPDDLSVIIFGEDNDFNTRTRHPYSLLVEPRHLIGAKAAELIKLQKSGEKISDKQIIIPGELIIRKSCTTPKNILRKRSA
jgi:DNA-binding LacI/PurR family transcriptional regulator